MTWTSGVVLYVLIWWMVLFTTLPFGVRRAGDEDKGHDAGAPVAPRLWLKAGITTLIAAALWGVAYWLVESEIFSLR